jgi:hypothetical protein
MQIFKTNQYALRPVRQISAVIARLFRSKANNEKVNKIK